MSGGYSHVDTFDPKPRLAAEHDTSIGYEFGRPNFDRYLKAGFRIFSQEFNMFYYTQPSAGVEYSFVHDHSGQ